MSICNMQKERQKYLLNSIFLHIYGYLMSKLDIRLLYLSIIFIKPKTFFFFFCLRPHNF
jgi:hypothetical protein